MSSTKDSRAVLLFAAGCLTGAGVAAAVVSARKARAAEREAQTDCPAADMAAQQPSSIPGSSNKADSSPAAVGGYRPHQHEAKIKERIDRMERNESFRAFADTTAVHHHASVCTNLTAQLVIDLTAALCEAINTSSSVKVTSNHQSLIALHAPCSMHCTLQIDEHAVERSSVTVRVPATSANMGPGFDCLGMALNIWSEVTISRSE
eukprot:11240-Heterococcus_DN1.PRE.1